MKQAFSEKLKVNCFADFVLLLSTVIVGGFNEYVSCILSVLLCIYLGIKLVKNKRLVIKPSLTLLSVALIPIGYGFTCLYAVDSGMAFIGFLKYLPLVLFLVSLHQGKESSYAEILPAFAAVLTVISAIGMYIPFFKPFFTVAERLAGFFEYPNTFALFLLVCELLLFKKTSFKVLDIIVMAVLTFGIFLTGSRTVFVLLFVSNALAVFFVAKRSVRKILIIVFVCAVAVLIAFMLFSNNLIFARFLRISLNETTFVGRFLYFADALPLMLKHPFGMGYLGYSYVQHEIQTGVYTVRYIHNDFLQLVLDIGFIPALVFIAAIVRKIFKKDTPAFVRIILLTVFAHSCFDFNLQYLSIFFIILLLLEDNKKPKEIKKNLWCAHTLLALVLVLSVYMGTALALAHFEVRTLSDKLYPFNTDNKISMLSKETDVKRANDLAIEIQNQNSATYIPYGIKAKYAYSKGEIKAVINNKQIAFTKNPFNYDEYEEYCKMLINGIELYKKAGDTASVNICKTELLKTKALLEKNNDRLSNLGKQIKDQPKTTLSEDILHYIENNLDN